MKKILLFAVLSLWGLASLIALAAEETEEGAMSLADFLLVKGTALVSLALCLWAGSVAHRKGLLPEPDDED